MKMDESLFAIAEKVKNTLLLFYFWKWILEFQEMERRDTGRWTFQLPCVYSILVWRRRGGRANKIIILIVVRRRAELP